MKQVVESGLMTEDELRIYQGVRSLSVRWILPIQWVENMVSHHANVEKRISPPVSNGFLNALGRYRQDFHKLCVDDSNSCHGSMLWEKESRRAN